MRGVEEKYRDLVLRMSEGFVAIDEDRRLTFVNPKLCEMIEYSEEEIIGKDVMMFFDEENRKILERELAKRSKGESSRYKITWTTKTGRKISTLMSAAPIFKNGVHRGSYAVITDLSEIKEAEELYRTIIDAASTAKIGFAIVQDVGGIEAKHVYVNDYYCELTGYTREELYQMSGFDMVHPSVKEEVMERYRRKMRGEKQPIYNEFEWIRKDGKVRTVGLSSAVATYRGKPAFICYFRDITEEKRYKEELERINRELEKKNKELDDFVYAVSHDLKEPLRSITIFSDFLKEDYADKLDDMGKDYLERLQKAAVRMAELIDDLLKLSRIGRKTEEFIEVDLNGLLEEVREELAAAIMEKNVDLRIGKLPVVRCQPTLMKEVFKNLISNAIKFNESKKPMVEVRGEEKKDEYIFSVRDNGIGIEEVHIKRIFGIFQRLHHRDKYPGTGAGLAICKKIIEEHGGRIWTKSKVGEGSTFYFTIPKHKNKGGGGVW
ncbi:MAG: sensor histidine kinase [Candidatus Methanospirareceae archaeon]